MLQGLYLLLVTNRNSNILEDLDTLRLLSKLVPEYSGNILDEESIGRAAFSLIFAFDEVISNGHKENITVQQVKQNCEMESHEEKLHKMIIQSKINDTKDVMKRKAMEIEKTKLEQKRSGLPVGPGYNPSLGGLSGMSNRPLPDLDLGPSLATPSLTPSFNSTAAKAAGPKKGMQLGKAKGATSILETLAKEEGVADLEQPTRAAAGPAGGMVIAGE